MTTDDISSKVISLFERHRRGEPVPLELEEGGEMIMSPDGFNYVSLKQDRNGQNNEKVLAEMAACRHYLVKMVELHPEGHPIRLNNYHVPGERLQEFLQTLPHRPGKILEISQFIPDHMA